VRYARKVDDNQGEIVDALEAIGVGVVKTSSLGEFCDLVTFQRGTVRLLEVKDGSKPPSKRKLTPAQITLHGLAERHGCKVHVVATIDDALRVHGAR